MIKKPIAVSLFSGAGGMDIGLEEAGFEVRCAVEINPDACASLRANKLLSGMAEESFDRWFECIAADTYSRWEPSRVQLLRDRIRSGVGKHVYLEACSIIEADIKVVPSSAILDATRTTVGEIDLIAGGPPCQSFSRAGKQESVEDTRGQLFMEFVRIVRDLRPRWFLFENVKGLILSKTTIWKVRCSACGHQALSPFDSTRVAPKETDWSPNCAHCGSDRTCWQVESNKRAGALELILAEFERLGYTCQWHVLNAVDYGAPQYRERLFIIGSRDNEACQLPVPSHYAPNPGAMPLGEQRQVTLWDALFSGENPDHHWPLDPAKAVLWVKNVVRPHAEPVTWTLMRPAPTIGAHQAAKLAVAPFGVPEAQLARQQWHVLGRRQGDTKPVPVDHSYLSDADLLTLQTFPLFWFVAGTRMERAFQIGNAVPPILARQVGMAILGGGQSVQVPSYQMKGQRARLKETLRNEVMQPVLFNL